MSRRFECNGIRAAILAPIFCLLLCVACSDEAQTTDTSFGTDELVATDFGGYEFANAVAVQSDGSPSSCV